MPRLRLGYTKSRGGCLRCKQRRVKCDENRPCKACIRHGIECSLTTGPDPQEPPFAPGSISSGTPSTNQTSSPDPNPVSKVSESPTPTPTPHQPPPTRLVQSQSLLHVTIQPAPITAPSDGSALSSANSPLPTTPDPFPYFAKYTTVDSPGKTENWASDLELMHHYTTSTYKTLATGYSLGLWQSVMPKLAFENTFLLHNLLATSAFHLAYLHPKQSITYTLQATHHQSRAIEGVREAITDITSDNCHALFASASFLFVGSLAASRPVDNTDFSVDNLIDVFLLTKGIRGILDATDELAHGPLRELFQPLENTSPNPALARLIAQLQQLRSRVPEIAPISGDRNAAAINHEIDRMIDCIDYAGRHAVSPEYQTLAAWPLSVSEAFIGLLRRRNQAALALLSYYCVVMYCTEDGFWFTHGWSMSVIRDIAKVMSPPWNQDSAWALAWISGEVSIQ